MVAKVPFVRRSRTRLLVLACMLCKVLFGQIGKHFGAAVMSSFCAGILAKPHPGMPLGGDSPGLVRRKSLRVDTYHRPPFTAITVSVIKPIAPATLGGYFQKKSRDLCVPDNGVFRTRNRSIHYQLCDFLFHASVT